MALAGCHHVLNAITSAGLAAELIGKEVEKMAASETMTHQPGYEIDLPATLPPTREDAIHLIKHTQEVLRDLPQAEVPTEHVIHGGMYSRTIRLEKDVVITGCLYKVPTIVIVNGSASVFVGDKWKQVCVYNVFPASAGRKQVFIAHGPVEITMTFATKAQTVEEAEAEMTDEAEQLLSRRQENNVVNITGE